MPTNLFERLLVSGRVGEEKEGGREVRTYC